jgi:hypothetical protein
VLQLILYSSVERVHTHGRSPKHRTFRGRSSSLSDADTRVIQEMVNQMWRRVECMTGEFRTGLTLARHQHPTVLCQFSHQPNSALCTETAMANVVGGAPRNEADERVGEFGRESLTFEHR